MGIRLGGLGLLVVLAIAAPPRSVQLPGQVIPVPGSEPKPAEPTPLPPEVEVQTDLEKRRLLFEELNRNNPMAVSQATPAPQAPQLSPEQIEQIKKLQALLENPQIKKYISVISDPQISAELQQLLKSDRLKHAGIAQVIWIFIYFGIKGMMTERLREAKVMKRILARLGLFCVFIFVASVALPAAILGSGYLRILSRIYAVVVS